ncbi:MAG: hypothetical protein AABY64_06605 [Bdellovibrionota bacterium]
MKKVSLVSQIRKLALSWTLRALVLTLSLSALIFIALLFNDTEREAATLANAIISSRRTEILSGDIRSVELQLNKELAIKDNENLLFLDSVLRPWVGDLNTKPIEPCLGSEKLCRVYSKGKIVLNIPIYFDQENKNLWGYLYMEKHPTTNWTLIISVVIAIFMGMFVQALGLYLNLLKSIKSVSSMVVKPNGNLNLKKRSEYSKGALES